MLGATSWHQDNDVVRPEADETNMLTVWFPLTPTREGHAWLSPGGTGQPSGWIDHLLRRRTGWPSNTRSTL